MKRMILLVAVFVSSLLAANAMSLQSVYALADASSQQACETIKNINPNSSSCAASDRQISKVIRIALQMLSIVAGIIAVIMVIISGLKYVTSQGDSNQISSAKNSLIYAVVGIVVVVFAQIIVQFVVDSSDNGFKPNPTEESSVNERAQGTQRRFETTTD